MRRIRDIENWGNLELILIPCADNAMSHLIENSLEPRSRSISSALWAGYNKYAVDNGPESQSQTDCQREIDTKCSWAMEICSSYLWLY